MEKKQAQEYITQVLNSRFDQEQFELFVRNLLNEFEPRDNNYSGNLIPEAFRDHIAHYKRIGKYTDPEGEPMDILIVQTRSVNKLERTRTALRNFVVRHLKNFDKYYALVAFYSKEDDGREWRLSLVKIDIEQERTEKGKIKAKEEIVPAKRFSFLVGKYENAHTAQKQLLPLLVNDHSNPLIIKEKDGDGSVEGAFSIEKVTDEFYEQYKELYLKLTENHALTETLEKEGLDPVRFVKKLLGQIVFLYFLQKKGWLGVPKDKRMGEGPKGFLRESFEFIKEKGGNYFNDFLRYLFYEALAKEHNDEGIKYFNKRLGCKIPFLNGGLFEADYENWDKIDLQIDNLLFSNPNEKTKAGDKGTGILDVFDRYNFTIREDEPLEKEVAVDPEMLGKVFENLLDVTDRKSKGAFYTPREIVHYMCQESLIHYLDNTINNYTENYQPIDSDQTSLFGGSTDKKGDLKIELENKADIRVPKEDLEQFIRHGHLVLEHETTVTGKGKETRDYKYKLPESIRNNALALDKALADIKICDPAIGSGAFPVGLLHEIITARSVLFKAYLEEKFSKSSNSANPDSDIYTPYNLKRHAIQESIYGVDIDASAIDIARLRLWLSMIVDEEDYETIDALPNLDYKIVCGNSLIGLPAQGASRYPGLSDQLETFKEKFFNETNEAKKKLLRNQINEQINKVLKAAENFEGYKIDFDFKLFFSEVWHHKDGFDVVIGNPPYVRVQNLKHSEIDFFKKNYKFAFKRIDISILFFEKSFSITNKNGLTNYISSNQFLSTEYGRMARKYLSSWRAVDKMVDFGSLPVFQNALTYVSIFFLNMQRKEYCNYAEVAQLPFEIPKKFNKISFRNLSDEPWKLEDEELIRVLNKVIDRSFNLRDIAKSWAGIITGNDKLLLFNSNNLPDYIESELLIPVLRAQSFNRYTYAKPNKHTFYPYKEVDGKTALIPLDELKKNFPKAYNFIIDNENALKNRKDSRKLMGDKKGWYGLIRFGALSKFNEIKIVSPGEVKSNKFAIDLTGAAFSCARVFSINPKLENLNLFCLLGILNSETVEFYLHKSSSLKAGGYYSYSSTVLDTIPISNEYEQGFLSTIVSYILELRNEADLLRSFFDELINCIVYNLYFKAELKSANKQIIPHLGDLKPITDEMSEEEKLAIIQSEFERLYDPNHPVRNNLETLDSVEEVRIIKEALK